MKRLNWLIFYNLGFLIEFGRITGIFVVNDSGWLYPTTGEQIILDNVTVNNLTATGPVDN
jgi:hypothetical protein